MGGESRVIRNCRIRTPIGNAGDIVRAGLRKEKCIEEYTWYHIRQTFANTEDTPDMLSIDAGEIMSLGSILTGQ